MRPVYFDAFLAELRRSCALDAAQERRLLAVFRSWGGASLWLPARSAWRRRDAAALALHLQQAGVPALEARQRLVSMGLSTRQAQRVLRSARQRQHAAVGKQLSLEGFFGAPEPQAQGPAQRPRSARPPTHSGFPQRTPPKVVHGG